MTPITHCDVVKQGKVLAPTRKLLYYVGSSTMEHKQNSAVFGWVVINCLLFNKWNLLIVQGEFIKIIDVLQRKVCF